MLCDRCKIGRTHEPTPKWGRTLLSHLKLNNIDFTKYFNLNINLNLPLNYSC